MLILRLSSIQVSGLVDLQSQLSATAAQLAESRREAAGLVKELGEVKGHLSDMEGAEVERQQEAERLR